MLCGCEYSLLTHCKFYKQDDYEKISQAERECMRIADQQLDNYLMLRRLGEHLSRIERDLQSANAAVRRLLKAGAGSITLPNALVATGVAIAAIKPVTQFGTSAAVRARL